MALQHGRETDSADAALRIRSGAVDERTERAGAVVVGGDYQGLGIVRSLGRRGIPVCIVDDELSIARFSRYASGSVRVEDLRDQDRSVETVLDIGQRLDLDGWVLFPTREEHVAAFARHRSLLEERFRVPTPAWRTISAAWDKRNTYRLASELSIPTPRTWYPRHVDELEQVDLEGPVVIKPAIKERFLYTTKAKAWRADNRQELVDLFQKAQSLVGRGEVMVQEFIAGGGDHQFAYCAFFKNGTGIASMVVQRKRQHPPEFGRASTFVETIELPMLEALSERFLRAIDYYGLVELEYKLDPDDGHYKLLDVNARTWGYHSLGAGAGVDFPYLLFADQMGWEVGRCRARPGVRWMRLVTDVPTAILEIARGRLHWRAYLQSLRDFEVEAVFSRDDPKPWLLELGIVPYLFARRGF